MKIDINSKPITFAPINISLDIESKEELAFFTMIANLSTNSIKELATKHYDSRALSSTVDLTLINRNHFGDAFRPLYALYQSRLS